MFRASCWHAPISWVAVLLVLPATAAAGPVVFSSAGADPASIQATVDAYRTALGSLNPNVPGSFAAGRREINWDGVPNALAAPNDLPANFFNANSPRGAVFSTPGTGFRVSANAVNPTGTPVRFGEINATYPDIFQTFSAQRLFTSLGSNVTDVSFFVPGSSVPATIAGFGAVFTNVGFANITSISYFDLQGSPLGTFFVPDARQGLSFLGVLIDAGERVGRVEITSGDAALGPNDAGNTHVVVMDDFIYAEPQPVPEPGSLSLLGIGLFALLAYGCRPAHCRQAVRPVS